MLLLDDNNDKTQHEFSLNSVSVDGARQTFTLSSSTYESLDIQFTLELPKHPLPLGYSVTVHLFKNPFHLQRQVIDLRTADRARGGGRIGYMFDLEALFTPGVLQLDSHRYCYAYFGVEYLFQHSVSLQTKDAIIKSDPYSILDFFDDSTIMLVLCDQFCDEVSNFNLNNYLPNLFLNGFKLFSKSTPIEIENDHSYLQMNYESFTITNPPIANGICPIRLAKAKVSISSEAYVVHLFTNLIQKKFDQVTRFLMLYQVVEIFMPKMIHLEARQRICQNLNALTSDKVKDLVIGLTKQGELITALLTRHAIPRHTLTTLLRQEILDFFIHVNHPEFLDHTKHPSLTLTDLFYAFRNKIVHEYRILHEIGVDKVITDGKVDTINRLTEALIAEAITVFTG